jgi:hypothetical protein
MPTPEPTPESTPPVTPPVPAPATPPAPAPAGTRGAAEIENDLLKERLSSRDKDKDLHNLKEKNRKLEEQNTAARAALKASGFITGDDPTDAKAIVEKQEKDSRSKERRDHAIERAATRKLLSSGLGEEEADLILGKVVRDSRIGFDEASGVVTGMDEVFAALKPSIERLAAKSGTAPAPAPPVPPAPKPGSIPMDTEHAAIKTWDDLMAKTITFQEKFEAEHPAEFKRMEAMWKVGANKGRPITIARPAAQPPMR